MNITFLSCILVLCSNCDVLLDANMHAKISDFGLAKEQPSMPDGKSYVKVESMRGSRGYEADEYYDGQLNTKLDVFSFGVVSSIYLH